MFYSQNVDNIQLVILTLDGGLLDLNRLRYNYFKRTCESYNKTISMFEMSPKGIRLLHEKLEETKDFDFMVKTVNNKK